MTDLTRRSFLKLLTGAVATPVIAQASAGLILPARLEGIIETVDFIPEKAWSDAAGYASGYYTPGGSAEFYDYVLTRASMSLPYGTRFELRGVPMSGADMKRLGAPCRPAYSVVWVAMNPIMPRLRTTPTRFYNTHPLRRSSPIWRGDHILLATWTAGLQIHMTAGEMT